MAVTQICRPVLPKIYPKSASLVRADIKRVTQKFCRLAKTDMDTLFGPWNHHPNVTVVILDTPVQITGTTATDDLVTWFLDGGTDERWAVMSNPFEPKTRKRSLRSTTGVGGAIISGRGAMLRAGMNAKPGIEAREFSKALKEKYERPYGTAIDKVMADAVTKGQAKP
jgi:hypothetical protein